MSDLTPKGFSDGQYVDRYLLRDKLYAEDAITMKGVAILNEFPAADVVEIPEEGIEFLSDGYHTFNSLYFQRLVLFAALVKAYKDRAWKSWKHEDGEPCFGGGWFIVGIDTPHGSYTYHYEGKDFDLFECEELPVAKHWDGHTEADATRLLSLPDVVAVVRCRDCKHSIMHKFPYNYEKVLACNDPHGVTIRAVKPMHFCSYGERKDGGQDDEAP